MFNKIKTQIRKEHCAFGNIGQWTGVFLLIMGFLFLLETNAELFYKVLTGGSIIFTLATKLKHERKS